MTKEGVGHGWYSEGENGEMCIVGYMYDGVIKLLRLSSPDVRLQHQM